MILTGKTPAFAEREADAAATWVGKNQGRLPQRYNDLVPLPESYRKAVFRASTPQVRSQLWVDHLKQYRASHPALSAEQTQVVDRAISIMGRESTFVLEQGATPEVYRQLDDLKEAAVRALGHDEAYALLAALGPVSQAPGVALQALRDEAQCECATESNWCNYGFGQCSANGSCQWSANCGVGYNYWCDGLCY